MRIISSFIVISIVAGLTGCQSQGLGTTALAHAHQTLEGPSTPEEAAEWQGRKKPGTAEPEVPAETDDPEAEGETTDEPDASEGETNVPPPPSVDAAKLFRENAAQLFRMSWQTRTRLQVNGAEVLEVLHKVQIDQNGDLNRRVLSSRQRSSAQPSGVEVSHEEWEATAEALADLMYAYTVTSMGAVSRAVQDQEAMTKPGGVRTVSGHDAVIPGDSVTIELSNAGSLQALYFDAPLDAKTAAAEVFYRLLPHGPAYPARAQIRLPEENLQATIESFSFRSF